MIDELVARIADLEKRVANLNRIAQVSYVYRKAGDPGASTDDDGSHIGKVDVVFEGHTRKRVPFLTMRHGEDKTFWLPSAGELGLLHAPSGDLANAVFVPGLVYRDFPAHIPDGIGIETIKRVFRDGSEEEIDVGTHSYKLKMLDPGPPQNPIEPPHEALRIAEAGDEIKDEFKERGVSKGHIKIDGSEIEIKHVTGKVKEVAGANMNELTAILMNLIGAHFFPTGITTLQSPVGPVFFAPAVSPAAAPSPPSGSSPNADGEVTKVPKSEISGVKIKATSNISLVLPAIPVTVAGSAGVTTPGTYAAQVTGTINLEFPARSL